VTEPGLVCDFHCHSTCSDGTLAPVELIEEARRCAVDVLALTDHDTIAGIEPARAHAVRIGLEFIPGIELSVSESDDQVRIHILGLGIDASHPTLLEHLEQFRDDRARRARGMVERLQALGHDIRLEHVALIAGSAPLARPHLARALVARGISSSIEDAFTRFLRRGRPAYVARDGPAAKRVIELIHGAGGIASMAHPPLSAGIDRPGGLEAAIGRLVHLGLDAVEVTHPRHKTSEKRRLRRIVRRYGLLATGGSDFHGPDRSRVRLGESGLAPAQGHEIRDALRERITRQQGAR